ncbi:MAG: endonuclease/exonuclease/phosphatase family protein [Parvibaculaceae bacterium]
MWSGLVLGLAGLTAGRLAWIWWPADAFNHFVPHFAVVATASLLGLLLPRRKLLAAGLALVLGLGVIPAAPFAVKLVEKWSPPTAKDSRVIRVMSFNTWVQNSDWRAILREIERNDPDIVTLVEYRLEKNSLHESLADRYPYQADCMEQRHCFMALFSKFPFQDPAASTHWRSPPQILAHFGPELGGLVVVGMHTLRPPDIGPQRTQIEKLASQASEMGGSRIFMGDFNATPFSRMLQTFTEKSGLRRITWLPSWPANFGPFPQVAIDHIFLSDDLEAVGWPRIGNNAGSDHYPVIADVRLAVTPPGRTSVGAVEAPR